MRVRRGVSPSTLTARSSNWSALSVAWAGVESSRKMLHSYPEAEEPWSDATWLDLCDANESERSAVERATGLRIPDRSAVSEIETTSRVYTENDALYLSTPIPASANASEPLSAVGFVLTPRVLISVRFTKDAVFDAQFHGCQSAPL